MQLDSKLIIKLTYQMREDQLLTNSELEDQIKVSGDIYSPLTVVSWQEMKREAHRISKSESFSAIFAKEDTNEPSTPLEYPEIAERGDLGQQIREEMALGIIINNTKQKQNPNLQKETHFPIDPISQPLFSYNHDNRVLYPQTPAFTKTLQSPFVKFNSNYLTSIYYLSTANNSGEKIKQVDPSANPLSFRNSGGAYFGGIAIWLKKQNLIPEALFFFNLACFVEPYCSKIWDEYISLLKNEGQFKQSCIVAKTAFLLNPLTPLGLEYLLSGDKAGVPMYELRGLVSSLKHPHKFQKLIVESTKLEMKNRKVWRGLYLLCYLCAVNDFRPNLGQAIILLAKQFQNLHQRPFAILILQKSFKKGLSKLEAYELYLQMKLRENDGFLSEMEIEFLESKTDAITLETRYRWTLNIAEALLNQNDIRYEKFIKKSVELAVKFCNKGAGRDRALRQVYFTALKHLKAEPLEIFRDQFPEDEHLIFEVNRYRFVNNQPLIIYKKFKDWKYYLHYALIKNYEIMIEASREWPQTGRLVAQCIHVLRTQKQPLAMLKYWREKIDFIPKSGELWCEGGRIYAQLHQYTNASKCFFTAIHFTPQFGDTFFEQLKIHLRKSQFVEIDQLKKTFLLYEPFYGNVLSFIKNKPSQNNRKCRLSFNEIWNNALTQIAQSLYSKKQNNMQLTALPSYNFAFLNHTDAQLRQRLFTSYEQMENKNAKN